MMTRKLVLVAMSLSTFALSLPRPVFADGKRGTKAEEERYATREAQAPGLDRFEGGGCCDIPWWAVPLIVLSIPLALPIYGIMKLVELANPPSRPHPHRETAPKPVPDSVPVRPAPPTPPSVPLALGGSR
jgi:hypothetical protein